jgi:hypothetical protein
MYLSALRRQLGWGLASYGYLFNKKSYENYIMTEKIASFIHMMKREYRIKGWFLCNNFD